jgi:hypothetical protein
MWSRFDGNRSLVLGLPLQAGIAKWSQEFGIDIKTGTFDQPELFDPTSIWTRHFLQYARRARARISSSSHAFIMFS